MYPIRCNTVLIHTEPRNMYRIRCNMVLVRTKHMQYYMVHRTRTISYAARRLFLCTQITFDYLRTPPLRPRDNRNKLVYCTAKLHSETSRMNQNVSKKCTVVQTNPSQLYSKKKMHMVGRILLNPYTAN